MKHIFMKHIFLIFIGLSSLSLADFTKITDVVTDSVTGLEWQDNNISGPVAWESAINFCEGLSLQGGAWRVPNKVELLSLVDDTEINPSIYTGFDNTTGSSYWTSTSYAKIPQKAWQVNFAGSQTEKISKYSTAYIRCVREPNIPL
jgi:hypothetical protein